MTVRSSINPALLVEEQIDAFSMRLVQEMSSGTRIAVADVRAGRASDAPAAPHCQIPDSILTRQRGKHG